MLVSFFLLVQDTPLFERDNIPIISGLETPVNLKGSPEIRVIFFFWVVKEIRAAGYWLSQHSVAASLSQPNIGISLHIVHAGIALFVT